MLDVNRLLLFDMEINANMDHYLYHVCSVGTNKTHYLNPARDNNIVLLQKKLSAYYPDTHPVILIRSNNREAGAPRLVEGTVGALPALLPEISFSTTLFVPARLPTRIDRNYLKPCLSG